MVGHSGGEDVAVLCKLLKGSQRGDARARPAKPLLDVQMAVPRGF
jgi:hypothetical protein